MTLDVGDKAPEFSLYDTEKNLVKLEDLKGKSVVVLFFPMAYTSVCTAELCGVRDNMNMYDSLNAKVFGISVDSPFTLGQFKKDQNLQFSLLSDFNKEACRAYGAIYEDFVLGMKGVAKRAAFVIDPQGNIKYSEVLENAGELPNFEAIKSTLQKISN